MHQHLTRIVAGAALALLGAGAAPMAYAADDAPRHIFYIMMENHGYAEIIGNDADAPFINSLARQHNVATRYYGVTHPSLPNYLAAISGDYQGIFDDCKAGATCAPEEFVPDSGDATAGAALTPAESHAASTTVHTFIGRNLVDQLEESGYSWKAYFQGLPSAGDATTEYAPLIGTSTVKLYAQKHNPFVYFSDIRGNPARLARLVPFDGGGGLAADLDSRHVPNFVFIAPDQCHDMHGVSPGSAALIGLPACGYPDSGLDHGAIRLGDAFLRDTVGSIRRSWTWRHERSSIVIVWDEDDYSGYEGCCRSPVGQNGAVLGGAHVPLIVINNGPREERPQGVRADRPANHYSLLGTIEQLWDLGCLANTCGLRHHDLLTDLFKD
jgi:hypothetical protein